jgi:cell division protein FtsL
MKPPLNLIDAEYAIKKDVRNNPIYRENDGNERRAFGRTAGLWALIVFMALFAAWQHFQMLKHGYEIEKVLQERVEEEAINRRLRLLVETLRAPARIEMMAINDLHMVAPPAGAALVIERVTPATADRAVVARANGVTEPRR